MPDDPRHFIRKPGEPTPDPPLTIHDELCRDYRLHSHMIRDSEQRGDVPPSDEPDATSAIVVQLVAGMVRCRTRMRQLADVSRKSPKARHAYLTISNIERRLSRDIADLSDLDTEWSEDGVD